MISSSTNLGDGGLIEEDEEVNPTCKRSFPFFERSVPSLLLLLELRLGLAVRVLLVVLIDFAEAPAPVPPAAEAAVAEIPGVGEEAEAALFLS